VGEGDSDSIDTFQDAQVDFLCDDKSMGIQLCEDLPLNERKLKLEEMVSLLQKNTIAKTSPKKIF
jgi:hypothetical protein